ncbi:MAG: hypothetical protein Q4F84_00985, partial [Fibrobacter sp.]|nr:hypothetical protein [Fibrobacter sp.]
SSNKNHSYSPSASYNYGNSSQYGSSMSQSSQHHSRNKPQRPGFNKGTSGKDDRLIKQNDMIIRLLKEIRDRLPEPEKCQDNVSEHIDDTREENIAVVEKDFNNVSEQDDTAEDEDYIE